MTCLTALRTIVRGLVRSAEGEEAGAGGLGRPHDGRRTGVDENRRETCSAETVGGRRGRSLARQAALVVLGVVAAGGAHAHRCDPTDNDRREAMRVISRIAARIDVMEERVVEALRLQTAQQTGYQAQSAKALTQALDAQTRLQAQTAREVEETRVMRARAPSANACATATGVAGLRDARDAAENARRAAGRIETGRIANDRAVAPSPGAAADADARFGAVTSTWCSAARAGDAACKGEDDRHAADLKAGETLFDRRTIASQDELRAAVELARNLAAPVIHDPPPLASAETAEERRLVLLGRSADARSALAADYFAALRALRAPAAGLGAWAEAVAPGARDPAKPVSRYELLELLASRRHEDPAWTVGLQAMGAENLLREIAVLLSLQLQLDWQRFRLDERRGALAAVRLALGAEEMRRLPGLDNPAAGAN